MPKLVFLPPQRDFTRAWAAAVTAEVPELRVVVAEDLDDTRREIADADAAFGAIPPELVSVAGKLKWLQAPSIPPPAGYYSPGLIPPPVTVPNFPGLFNDPIPPHIMAFLLAFAPG